MAPLPVITDTYRCAFNWINSDDTSVATNVMHIRKSASNPAAVATVIDTNVTANMWQCTSGHWRVAEVAITPLDGTGVTFPFVPAVVAKWAGNGGAGDWIPNVATIAKFVTAKRGRSYRGRAYLPATVESLQSNGTVVAANVTSGTNAWIAYGAALVAAGFTPVVASYLHSTADAIIAYTFESRIATQRRRLFR